MMEPLRAKPRRSTCTAAARAPPALAPAAVLPAVPQPVATPTVAPFPEAALRRTVGTEEVAAMVQSNAASRQNAAARFAVGGVQAEATRNFEPSAPPMEAAEMAAPGPQMAAAVQPEPSAPPISLMEGAQPSVASAQPQVAAAQPAVVQVGPAQHRAEPSIGAMIGAQMSFVNMEQPAVSQVQAPQILEGFVSRGAGDAALQAQHREAQRTRRAEMVSEVAEGLGAWAARNEAKEKKEREAQKRLEASRKLKERPTYNVNYNDDLKKASREGRKPLIPELYPQPVSALENAQSKESVKLREELRKLHEKMKGLKVPIADFTELIVNAKDEELKALAKEKIETGGEEAPEKKKKTMSEKIKNFGKSKKPKDHRIKEMLDDVKEKLESGEWIFEKTGRKWEMKTKEVAAPSEPVEVNNPVVLEEDEEMESDHTGDVSVDEDVLEEVVQAPQAAERRRIAKGVGSSKRETSETGKAVEGVPSEGTQQTSRRSSSKSSTATVASKSPEPTPRERDGTDGTPSIAFAYLKREIFKELAGAIAMRHNKLIYTLSIHSFLKAHVILTVSSAPEASVKKPRQRVRTRPPEAPGPRLQTASVPPQAGGPSDPLEAPPAPTQASGSPRQAGDRPPQTGPSGQQGSSRAQPPSVPVQAPLPGTSSSTAPTQHRPGKRPAPAARTRQQEYHQNEEVLPLQLINSTLDEEGRKTDCWVNTAVNLLRTAKPVREYYRHNSGDTPPERELAKVLNGKTRRVGALRRTFDPQYHRGMHGVNDLLRNHLPTVLERVPGTFITAGCEDCRREGVQYDQHCNEVPFGIPEASSLEIFIDNIFRSCCNECSNALTSPEDGQYVLVNVQPIDIVKPIPVPRDSIMIHGREWEVAAAVEFKDLTPDEMHVYKKIHHFRSCYFQRDHIIVGDDDLLQRVEEPLPLHNYSTLLLRPAPDTARPSTRQSTFTSEPRPAIPGPLLQVPEVSPAPRPSTPVQRSEVLRNVDEAEEVLPPVLPSLDTLRRPPLPTPAIPQPATAPVVAPVPLPPVPLPPVPQVAENLQVPQQRSATEKISSSTNLEKYFKEHPNALHALMDLTVCEDVEGYKKFFSNVTVRKGDSRCFEMPDMVTYTTNKTIMKGDQFGKNGDTRYSLLQGYIYEWIEQEVSKKFKKLVNDKDFPGKINGWGMVASDEGVITMSHSDLCGGAPTMVVFTGEKVWYLQEPTPENLRRIEGGLTDIRNDPQTVVVRQRAGETIFLRPGTIHLVVTTENTLGVASSVIYEEEDLTMEHVSNAIAQFDRARDLANNDGTGLQATTLTDPFYEEQYRTAGMQMLKEDWKEVLESLADQVKRLLTAKNTKGKLKEDKLNYTYDIGKLRELLLEKGTQLPSSEEITDKPKKAYDCLLAGTAGFTRSSVTKLGQKVVSGKKIEELKHVVKTQELLAAMIVMHGEQSAPSAPLPQPDAQPEGHQAVSQAAPEDNLPSVPEASDVAPRPPSASIEVQDILPQPEIDETRVPEELPLPRVLPVFTEEDRERYLSFRRRTPWIQPASAGAPVSSTSQEPEVANTPEDDLSSAMDDLAVPDRDQPMEVDEEGDLGLATTRMSAMRVTNEPQSTISALRPRARKFKHGELRTAAAPPRLSGRPSMLPAPRIAGENLHPAGPQENLRSPEEQAAPPLSEDGRASILRAPLPAGEELLPVRHQEVELSPEEQAPSSTDNEPQEREQPLQQPQESEAQPHLVHTTPRRARNRRRGTELDNSAERVEALDEEVVLQKVVIVVDQEREEKELDECCLSAVLNQMKHALNFRDRARAEDEAPEVVTMEKILERLNVDDVPELREQLRREERPEDERAIDFFFNKVIEALGEEALKPCELAVTTAAPECTSDCPTPPSRPPVHDIDLRGATKATLKEAMEEKCAHEADCGHRQRTVFSHEGGDFVFIKKDKDHQLTDIDKYFRSILHNRRGVDMNGSKYDFVSGTAVFDNSSGTVAKKADGKWMLNVNQKEMELKPERLQSQFHQLLLLKKREEEKEKMTKDEVVDLSSDSDMECD